MNKDFYITLIARKLSDELSAAQLKDLSSWLMTHKDNAALMTEFKSVWQMTGNYKQSTAINVDTAFDSFTRKFDIPKAEPSVLETFARKKLILSIRYPLLILFALCLAAILYFSGVFATKSVSNDNMHAMTVQLDNYSSLTLAPKSSYIPGKSSDLAGNQREHYEQLFTTVENQKSKRQIDSESQYNPVATLFEPEDKNYMIEAFEGQGFFELKSINENQAFLGLDKGVSLGTLDAAFNLQNYEDENAIIIDVKSGTVVLYDGRSSAYIIKAGERAIYDEASNILRAGNMPGSNPFKWHKGILVFDNTSLTDVFEMIEKYYGVDIELTDDSSLDGINFTATMSMSNNLNDCLDLLHQSIDMTIRRKGLRTIEISDVNP